MSRVRARAPAPPRAGRSKADAPTVEVEPDAPKPSARAKKSSKSSAAAAPIAASAVTGWIRIRGARTHNLQGVDVDLPRGKLVTVTGPSGSGKSSLAFDTLFAEGQRRYVESLSVAARQFLAQLPKPDVDLVEGLSPTVAIAQDSRVRNPRSTVGTATEIHDFLRLLYARIGIVHSHVTGLPMKRHSASDIVDEVMALPGDTRLSILAPVAVDAAGDHRDLLDDLRRRGFVRVAIDDEVRDLTEAGELALDPGKRHTIEVYVDRLRLKPDVRGRLADSVELALGLTGGAVEVLTVGGDRLRFSERFAELEHGLAYPEITPALFSFNSPQGACPECDGLGVTRVFDPERLVDPKLSIRQGAVRPWARKGGAGHQKLVAALADHLKIDLDAPWSSLGAEAHIAILEGTGDEVVAGIDRPFEGVRPMLARRLRELGERSDDAGDDEPSEAEDIEAYLREVVCRVCEGDRLKLPARMVRIGGRNIAELGRMPLEVLAGELATLELPTGEAREIADAVLGQVRQRLKFLVEVGLGYLTLDRAMMTLSGGESQRIRLATQVGAALVGITYVLDEPSIGLHQRDNARLVAVLQHLRDLGNSVIVVEHDEDTMRASDWLVDMGPGAGPQGGRVVASGPTAEVLANPRSLTGAYLSGRMSIPVPEQRRRPRGPSIVVKNARGHNLQGVTVRFPIGLLTCVTGVSGSGKSSLVIDTLLAEAARVVNGAARPPLPCDGVDGLEHVDKVIHVDQSPIGRTPRSNPATYTGIFAELRTVFAGLPDAKIRGFQPARFSFNVKGGRCEACMGEGLKRIEMQFLPDVFVTCEVCGGKRYNRETLAITMRGKSIADVLALPIAEACDFFVAHPSIRRQLEVMREVGLGYLALGQSATTLSGGEAQRIKLARELARKSTGTTLFVLDEPTTGLHFGDVKQLLHVLQRLVDEGNTVVVIEHDLDVVKSADHVVDIGPEGGTGGGKLVTSGTPEYVARSEESHTARYLARALGR